MAEGDNFDDDLPGGHNPLDDINEIFLMNLRPQYVINATIINGNVRRTLPPIRIPRHFTAVNPDLFIGLVRRALTNVSQYPLVGPPNNPLLSMLALRADYWSVTLDSSGDCSEVGFFPVFINTPSVSESSTDDEQPGPFDLDSNSEARAGESSTSSSSTGDTTNDTSSTEEPGPSNLVNSSSEDSSGGSRTSVDESSGSQVKRQGVKRQREHCRSESQKLKRRRSDHNPDFYPMYVDNSPESRWGTHMNRSSTDDEEPGPSSLFDSSKAGAGGSRTPSDQSSDSQVKGVKRKRKTSDRSESKESKRRRSARWSDSDSDSSRDSLSSSFSAPRDNEQPEPSYKDNSEVRTERSRTPSDQSSVSQEMRQGGKRKRKTSGRSESKGRKRSRLDHRSGSASDDDQPGPSVRDNNEARAGGSRALFDQSSSLQIKMRQGVKRKRQASVRSESREWKRWRSDHWSDSESDSLSSDFASPGSLGETSGDNEQPEPSDRENSEARASDDQIRQDESEQEENRKRKISELPGTQSKRRKSDHQSDSSVDSFISDFSRMCISTPPAACGKMSIKSSNADEQDEPSQLVNSSEVRAGESTAISDQSSDSPTETRQSLKRKAKTSDRGNNEAKAGRSRAPSDQSSGSQIETRQSLKRKAKRLQTEAIMKPKLEDPEHLLTKAQPGPSVRGNNEAKAGRSRAPSDQSSGSQIETRQSLKRKAKTSDRGNNEAKAGRSRAPSDQSSGSQIETRQNLKRKRQTSDRSEAREQKLRRSDRHK
ncbi:Glutamine-rich protein 2 [Labeo rohita]|uniref:Glutamine-rich protein 2 n=1 Tax=Labeo rohita TaxID=84645 RepID=A0ABQ8LJQ2_LABRO|nr:Glutamine-rich protein 2 [Labeo rohita]